jgi:hypothetical protein
MSNLQSPQRQWGPALWRQFHQYALQYTEDKAEEAKAWYRDFEHRIPCPTCVAKYRYLVEHTMALTPTDLQDADHLLLWTVRLHNRVNTILGKPQLDETEACTEIRKFEEIRK